MDVLQSLRYNLLKHIQPNEGRMSLKSMKAGSSDKRIEKLIAKLSRLCKDDVDRNLVTNTTRALEKYALSKKIAREPGVEEIILQMVGRLAKSYYRLSDVKGKRILDIACGSNTSKAPSSIHIDTPFGEKRIRVSKTEKYTAQFEPWFCRILLELGAVPIGVDFGDLDGERFEHFHVDLGVKGALDFLPSHSFDAVQDSRLFGSPEFTAIFPERADRLTVAQEIRRQEQKLLKPDGIVIHSDIAGLLQ